MKWCYNIISVVLVLERVLAFGRIYKLCAPFMLFLVLTTQEITDIRAFNPFEIKLYQLHVHRQIKLFMDKH